jgi:hypothetical protein
MQIRKVGMGEGGVTVNNRESEGVAKVGQPVYLHIPYANKDKDGDVGRGDWKSRSIRRKKPSY